MNAKEEAKYWKQQYYELREQRGGGSICVETADVPHIEDGDEVEQVAASLRRAFWGECKPWENCCQQPAWRQVARWAINWKGK